MRMSGPRTPPELFRAMEGEGLATEPPNSQRNDNFLEMRLLENSKNVTSKGSPMKQDFPNFFIKTAT